MVCDFCNGFYCAQCLNFILILTSRFGFTLSNRYTNICIRKHCLLAYLNRPKFNKEKNFSTLNEERHGYLFHDYYVDAKFVCRHYNCYKALSPADFITHEASCTKGVLHTTVHIFYKNNDEWLSGEKYLENFFSLEISEGNLIPFLPSHLKEEYHASRCMSTSESNQIEEKILTFIIPLLKDYDTSIFV